MAFAGEEATKCVGRWRLHADAVDDGAFPMAALEAFTRFLEKQEAIASAALFRIEDMDRSIMQSAAQEAEARLRKALGGDREAFQAYFDALGRCSYTAETVIDTGAAERGDGE